MKTRVYIVDDHSLVAQGLGELLGKAEGIQIVGMAHTGEAALREIRAYRPEIVLQDLNLPDMTGQEVMRRTFNTGVSCKFLFLSVLPENSFALELIAQGAAGFLNKNARFEELLKAIRTVRQGETYLSPDLKRLRGEVTTRRNAVGLDALSKREREVLMHLLSHKKSMEISEALGVTHGCLGSYITRIHRKLGTNSRSELIQYAIAQGLPLPGESS